MPQDKIVGIGMAGTRIIKTIAAENLKTLHLLAIDTTQDSLLDSDAHQTILLGDHGFGMAGDTTRGAALAEASHDMLYNALADTKRLILTYGLGGGTGAGVAPVLARLAHVMGIHTMRAVVVFPFHFEGTPRNTSAKNNLITLKSKVQQIRVIQSDAYLHFVGKTPTIQEAFSLINRAAMWHILSDLLQSP